MNVTVNKAELDELFSHEEDVILTIDHEHFIFANEAALRLLELSSIEVFKSLHPAMISPEFQPDGASSKVKADAMMTFALNNGSNRFLWQHIKLDRTAFEVEVTLRAKDERTLEVHWRLL